MMLAPLEDQNGELLKMLGKINLTLKRVEGKLNQGGNSVTLDGKRARGPLKCYKCKEVGHIKMNCPNPEKL